MNTKKAVESHIPSTALSLILIGTHTHKKHSYACRKHKNYSSTAACAAARRAIGTLNGEHEA